MARRRIANPLALAVLACLSEQPMHPYEISQTLKQRGKDHSIRINYGSLYGVVDTLERHELIRPVETQRDGNRPERTVYALTKAGETELHDWLSELIGVPAKEYPQFEAALSLLPVLPPDEALDLLDHRINALKVEIAAAEGVQRMLEKEMFPRLFSVESEYDIAIRKAELAFSSALAEDIRTGDMDGLAGWRRIHEMRAAGATPSELRAAIADMTEEVQQRTHSPT